MRSTAIKKKTTLMAMLAVLFATSSPAAEVEVPHVFTAGDVIKASEMNDNFAAVLDAVDNVINTPGAQGIPGVKGEQGDSGPAGPIGATGAAGSQGAAGINGTNAIDDTDLQANLIEIFARLAALESLHAYKIGDTGPGGGFVFYVNPDEPTMGLEASLADQNSSIWCSDASDLETIPNTDPGIRDPDSGVVNTASIISACGNSTAAGVAAAYEWPNGQTDGFLPNSDELSALFQHKDLVGGFTADFYWSSSEYTGTLGRGLPTGIDTDYRSKAAVNSVRAVRAFNRLSD